MAVASARTRPSSSLALACGAGLATVRRRFRSALLRLPRVFGGWFLCFAGMRFPESTGPPAVGDPIRAAVYSMLIACCERAGGASERARARHQIPRPSSPVRRTGRDFRPSWRFGNREHAVNYVGNALRHSCSPYAASVTEHFRRCPSNATHQYTGHRSARKLGKVCQAISIL